jgi:diaminopimelate decarboxylase
LKKQQNERKKTMPMSKDFKARLFPRLEKIADNFGTPFHIYDETGIRKTGERLLKAFARINQLSGFREFFAVKALPNLRIMKILRQIGFGFDCSSSPEVFMAREVGADGNDIYFTSNNTTAKEYKDALSKGGCILNLDDISYIEKVPGKFPKLISFRYNPGERRTGNSIIGKPAEAKYGVSHDQIVNAYLLAIKRGAKRFGIHTMVASNELNYTYMIETVKMLLEVIQMIRAKLGIEFEFINMGGGLGIPYKHDDIEIPLEVMAKEIYCLLHRFKLENGYVPKLYMESGRYITGPHGVLVTKAINRKEIYRTYIGVDACMSSLMRPGIYGAYHHIDVLEKEDWPLTTTADVVGSLCENNDKFAIQRALPEISDGDLLIIQDTGAHGHAMGFNYNARLRPQELLLKEDGSVELIRRAETLNDYLATQIFPPKILTLSEEEESLPQKDGHSLRNQWQPSF